VSFVYSSFFKSAPAPVREEETRNPNTYVPLDGSRINMEHPCWHTALVDGKEVAIYVGPEPATPATPTDPASPPPSGGGTTGAAGTDPSGAIAGTDSTSSAAPVPDPAIRRRIMTHEAWVREIVSAEFGARFEPVDRRITAVDTGVGALRTAMTDGFKEL
ncbi:MAG: hypothetical protein AABZ06_09115, partial [Bdellovibrionota bacterium]